MKKLISVVALAMIVVLMVGMMFGMARIKKAKAGCYTCRFDCVLPNGAPGATEWLGELESGDGVHYYCVGYSQISGCRNFC